MFVPTLQVKESKEKAMSILSHYRMAGSHEFLRDGNLDSQQAVETGSSTFVSLLEFVCEIYQVSLDKISLNLLMLYLV